MWSFRREERGFVLLEEGPTYLEKRER